MKITDKNVVEKLMKQTELHVKDYSEGISAREIAKRMYMTLEGKTEDVAYIMADHMADIIAAYHQDVDNCMEDENAFAEAKLREAVASIRDPLERCRVYHRMLVALEAYTIFMNGEENAAEAADTYIEEHGECTVTAEEAEDKEQELFKLTVEALANTNYVANQLPAIINSLEQESLAEAMKGAVAVLKTGRQTADLKLILAMQAYVNAQNGVYEDVSEDCSMEQIGYTVSAAMDACAVASQAAEGSIESSLASKILRAIGEVLTFIGILALVHDFLVITTTLLMTLLPLPLGIVASVALMVLVVVWMSKDKTLIDWVKEGGNLMVGAGRLVTTGVKGLVAGFNKLVEWTTPAVKSGWEWFKKRVKNTLDTLSSKIVLDEPAVSATPEKEVEPSTETEAEEEETEYVGEPDFA